TQVYTDPPAGRGLWTQVPAWYAEQRSGPRLGPAQGGMMAESALEVVNRFCAAWEKGNLDEIAGMITDDVVYHNIPLRPNIGREAVVNDFKNILHEYAPVRFEILRSAVNGDVVFNERVDHLTIKGTPFPLPVAGVFEVRNGRIAAWRDYFDMRKMRQALAAE
ncbi:MAG TPA: limonene-1,2-epoxide hydrolase family protein, partial [Dehalococcoidia bacterium]|nr:limonene-1,2-epoxide hydrolase family protein [Dehalococcoidia bacterium]